MFWILQNTRDSVLIFIVTDFTNRIFSFFFVVCKPFVFNLDAHMLEQTGVSSILITDLVQRRDHKLVQWQCWCIVSSPEIVVPVLLIIYIKNHQANAQRNPFGIVRLHISVFSDVYFLAFQQLVCTVNDGDADFESQMCSGPFDNNSYGTKCGGRGLLAV